MKMMTGLSRRTLTTILSATCALGAYRAAADVKLFKAATAEEFRKGTWEHLSVAAGGEIQLAPAVKVLIEHDAEVEGVQAAVRVGVGGSAVTIAATGSGDQLVRIDGEKRSPITLPEGVTAITTLSPDAGGNVLAGGHGDAGASLWTLDTAKGTWTKVWGDEKYQYVWTIAHGGDGNVFIGTGGGTAAAGGTGTVVRIAGGKATVVLQLKSGSVLSLAVDGKRGLLYVGTEPQGLVYRLPTGEAGEAKIIFDADQPDITGLLLTAEGNLLVAASTGTDHSDTDAGKDATPGTTNGNASGLPMEGPKETLPDLPAPPAPNPTPDGPKRLGDPTETKPAEPKPMEPKHFMVLPDDEAKPKLPPGLEKLLGSLGATTKPSAGGGDHHTATPTAEGSAVYLLTENGAPQEIYQTAGAIDWIAFRNGNVLIAANAGDDGAVLTEVSPAGGPSAELYKASAKDLTGVQALDDGTLLISGSDLGLLAEVSPKMAASGTYTSPVLDAHLPSQFGTLQMEGVLPKETTVTLAARSGTTADPLLGTWSEWSAAVPATRFNAIKIPQGRFAQYKITLTGDGSASPVLEEAQLAYHQANVPPVVKGVSVTGGNSADESGIDAALGHEPGAAGGQLSVDVEAADANDDKLAYSLQIRALPSAVFAPLAKDQSGNTFEIDASKLTDGRYQVRAVVTDAPSNPAGQAGTSMRLSRLFVIDRTPPVLGNVATAGEGADLVVTAAVSDATSTVAGVEWSVDSTDHWQNAEAVDTMFDSPQEAVKVTLRGLASGPHVVYLRLRDSAGNSVVKNVVVEVSKPGGK